MVNNLTILILPCITTASFFNPGFDETTDICKKELLKSTIIPFPNGQANHSIVKTFQILLLIRLSPNLS